MSDEMGTFRVVDEVVFGEPGDPVLLGSRSLEGLSRPRHPAAASTTRSAPAPSSQTRGR